MNINIYDTNLNYRYSIGNDYISCLWAEGYNTIEDFVIELPITKRNKETITVDGYIGRSDRPTLMVIKTVEQLADRIIASGHQASRVLGDVACKYIVGGQNIASTIKKEYDTNSAKFPHITIASSTLADTYPYDIGFVSFAELCETMCQYRRMGFKLVKADGNNAELQFYKPDSAVKATLSTVNGNLIVKGLSQSTDTKKNYAIILGDGEKAKRITAVLDLRETGEVRREIYIEASDIRQEQGETLADYKKRLVNKGAKEMLNYRGIDHISFVPYVTEFGSSFDLGDVVEISIPEYNRKLTARVTRFAEKSQENGNEITVDVGDIRIRR